MRSRILAGFLGALLIVFGLIAPFLNLIGFSAGGGTQIVFILVGIGLIGLAVIGQRANPGSYVRIYQQIAILLLNTLLFFAICEFLVIISFNLQLLTRGSTQVNSSREVAGYADQPWYNTYWEEHREVDPMQEYSPYSLWQRQPFSGETINVQADGSRFTPGTQCDDANAYHIYLYGGSTMWGSGVPDGMTIPSYLQETLNETGTRPICIVNYGELAMVSTQELIRLVKQIQRGDIPDMVIFYDGVNDVIATDWTGIPGAHRNYETFDKAMSQALPPHPLVDWVSQSNAFRFIGGLLQQQQPEVLVDSQQLARDTASIYLANTEIISSLGEHYNFKTYFFWQPVMVVENKPLTPEEEYMAAAVYPQILDLYRDTWQIVKESAPDYSNVYYIADALDGHSELLYFDHHHLTPQGNQLVAQRIFEIIRPAVEQ